MTRTSVSGRTFGSNPISANSERNDPAAIAVPASWARIASLSRVTATVWITPAATAAVRYPLATTQSAFALIADRTATITSVRTWSRVTSVARATTRESPNTSPAPANAPATWSRPVYVCPRAVTLTPGAKLAHAVAMSRASRAARNSVTTTPGPWALPPPGFDVRPITGSSSPPQPPGATTLPSGDSLSAAGARDPNKVVDLGAAQPDRGASSRHRLAQGRRGRGA